MFVHLPPTAAPLSSRALIKGLFGTPRGKPAVAGFEQLLEKYFDTQKVFTFTSGRAAFRVILETIKKRPDLLKPEAGDPPGVYLPGAGESRRRRRVGAAAV